VTDRLIWAYGIVPAEAAPSAGATGVAGDIRVETLEIELLTIKLRLLVASADKAREMGIDWWEGDPFISRRARESNGLESRLKALEEKVGLGGQDQEDQ